MERRRDNGIYRSLTAGFTTCLSKPVDIDLDDQESPDRIWTSRQHAVITLDNGALAIEDLNSLNGTFVNRTRVHPGQVRELHENDVIQVGTVHMKVIAG